MRLPNGIGDLRSLIQQSAISLESPGDHLIARPYRLGQYYENLVMHILSRESYLTEIKRNIQVISDKKTLGEFDFLGLAGGREGFHLEVAVKFYLRVGDGSELSHYIGPGKRDRLDLKWHKLTSQQLRLGDRDEAVSRLQELGFATAPSLRLALIQGYLFHPYADFVAAQYGVAHTEINPQHNKGWWLRQREISAISADCAIRLMEKPLWLTPASVHPEEDNWEKLQSKIATTDRPLLIARFDRKGVEIDRGFVVPDSW